MKSSDTSLIDESLSIIADTAQAWSGDEFPALSDLMRAHDNRKPHLGVLIRHFTQTRHPEHELEQHLWQTVHDYLQRLGLAYASRLAEPAPKQSAAMPRAVLQRLECLALLAEWHYLRYQPLSEFFWRQLHAAYRMAELITTIADDARTHYLQVLMLDGINRSSMSRSRIALLYAWLGDWCKDVALVQDYKPGPYQFFVDLDLPCGARPARHAAGGDCRYWSVESIVARLEAMHQQLADNVLPLDFPAKTTVANARRLTDKLLSEWSHNASQRERRGEQRQTVMKHAQVVHGIFNVCQHVKNTGFAGAPSQPTLAADEKTAAEDGWLIENESQFGFGTFVFADFNRWLEPGCLIAMNYDLNPDLAPVGIVRSIMQLSTHKYSVGIEVLSHTPSYVRLQQLVETEIGLERLPPVAAIFLPENDERKQPATVAMPVLDYVAAGLYELHTPQREHVIELGDVLEQQADWIRVGVSVAADITL